MNIHELTKSARGQLNAATKQLRDIGADPDEVPIRAERLKGRWGKPVTPSYLVKYWPSLGPDSDIHMATQHVDPDKISSFHAYESNQRTGIGPMIGLPSTAITPTNGRHP
jgi:hypothetical protein